MIILILGMHRSGTSAIAGMLHHGGVYLGDVFMPPLPENPKGFFEDLRFQGINKQILSSIGKDWDRAPAIHELRQVPRPVMLSIRAMVQEYAKRNPVWAWKDPRLCLTFPLWAAAMPLNDVKLIYAIRHPVSVARSLNVRNNKSLEEGFDLWNIYNLKILEILNHYRLPCAFVRYESLIEHPPRVQARLEQYLGIALNDAWRFVDKSLNRSEDTGMDDANQAMMLYRQILQKWENEA